MARMDTKNIRRCIPSDGIDDDLVFMLLDEIDRAYKEIDHIKNVYQLYVERIENG